MTIVPFIVDSRPPYLAQSGSDSSLLFLPLGSGTVLGHALGTLASAVQSDPIVLCTFPPSADYEQRIEALAGRPLKVLRASALGAHLNTRELADWLLLLDPSQFALRGMDLADIIQNARETGRAQHAIALERTPEGLREYVQFDEHGRIQQIQRFYDDKTFVHAGGAVASLVSVALLHRLCGASFESLQVLRKELAGRGVPSRDAPIPGEAIDLADEAGLIELNRALVLRDTATGADADRMRPKARIAAGARVAGSARLVGPVVIHAGAEVDAEAVVIGPAVLGGGARVQQGAVVADCVVAPGATIPARQVCRRQVVAGAHRAAPGPRTSQQHWVELERANHYGLAAQRDLGAGALEAGQADGGDWYPVLKRMADGVIAAIALAILSPLMLIVSGLVKLTSPGKALFGHEREGLGGRPFRCWKFRTMVADAHARQREMYDKNKSHGLHFVVEDDPRITWFGKILRKTNIDELPQLFNVLMGEMSLIGPRPSPFRENQICVPWRLARLSVRPGITGLWQLCRHERDAGDFHQWIYYDMLYVRHQSLWLDLKILVGTLLTAGGRWHLPLHWLVPQRSLEQGRATREVTPSSIDFPLRGAQAAGDGPSGQSEPQAA